MITKFEGASLRKADSVIKGVAREIRETASARVNAAKNNSGWKCSEKNRIAADLDEARKAMSALSARIAYFSMACTHAANLFEAAENEFESARKAMTQQYKDFKNGGPAKSVTTVVGVAQNAINNTWETVTKSPAAVAVIGVSALTGAGALAGKFGGGSGGGRLTSEGSQGAAAFGVIGSASSLTAETMEVRAKADAEAKAEAERIAVKTKQEERIAELMQREEYHFGKPNLDKGRRAEGCYNFTLNFLGDLYPKKDDGSGLPKGWFDPRGDYFSDVVSPFDVQAGDLVRFRDKADGEELNHSVVVTKVENKIVSYIQSGSSEDGYKPWQISPGSMTLDELVKKLNEPLVMTDKWRSTGDYGNGYISRYNDWNK